MRILFILGPLGLSSAMNPLGEVSETERSIALFESTKQDIISGQLLDALDNGAATQV
jgi:hypothetical protein